MSKHNPDTLFEKFWYPSRLNAYHAAAIAVSAATLVVVIALTIWPF